jgi:hypothetical protein
MTKISGMNNVTRITERVLQYPANFWQESWETGVKDVINRLNSQAKACPDQKFAIVGYSQGAMVIHIALNSTNLSPDALKRVVGGATFGDPVQNRRGLGYGVPDFPGELKAKVKLNCAGTDAVSTA